MNKNISNNFLANNFYHSKLKYSYSAIIPVHNAEENIVDLIISLKKLKYKPSQIIVVDDASSDNTNTLINKLEGITLITLKDNFGASTARNIGAEKATSEWLLFIDSDCILPPSNIQYAFPSNIEFKNPKQFINMYVK